MSPTPRIGQLVTMNGKDYRIIAVYPAGTMDVETLDGSRCYRVTGLSFR